VTDDPYRPDDADEGRASANRTPRITRIIPEPLRHWQVAGADEGWAEDWDDGWDSQAGGAETLEGEATLVEDAPPPPDDAPASAGERPIADIYDDVIVAGLESDRLAVNPGQSAAFQVRLLNNGRKTATFSVHVEGWIDERWITVYPVQTRLQAGEQATLTVAVAPPRSPASQAGDHPVAIVVRSSDYPQRQSRLGAILTIHPFDEIRLDELRPRRAPVNWQRQTATVGLAVSNRGNRQLTVQVWGRADDPGCRFEFTHPPSGARRADEQLLTLAPDQTEVISVHITPHTRPLVGLHPQISRYRIAATATDQPRAPREVSGQIVSQPLIGLWGLAAAGALAAAGLLLAALIGVGGLFTLQLINRAGRPPAANPAVVTIMLNMEQPAPSAIAPVQAQAPLPQTPPTADPPGVVAAAPPGAPMAASGDGSAPIVQPGQVTSPGAGQNFNQGNGQNAGAPVISAPPAAAPPASAPAPARSEDMTYEAMFQEIGGRYGLDWRMLAAQAYVESSFDALALGQDGELGLMQVMPKTWREWSPAVNANDPFDSYSNVLVAAAYLDYLRNLFSQQGYTDPKWMLVAYNWGPDKLLAFLDSGQSWDELAAGRRQYAEDILGIAASLPPQ
jgi:soluble lytic murein transglycosylase-like protein